MSRILNLQIIESREELKRQLHHQNQGRLKERLYALYLLKTQQVDTLFKLACILGRAHSTVKRWVKCYREQGLPGLLEIHPGGGRTLSLPQEVLGQLDKRLKEPKGFDHYTDIQTWLKEHYGIDVPYHTLYGLVHYRLKASPKVVRPQRHIRDEPEAIDFQKKALATKYHDGIVSG